MTTSATPWDDHAKAPNGQLVCDNFRNWFGASEVVDEEGDPLVVFHGTASKEPLTHFDRERQGQTAGVKGGFFFTSVEDIARDVYAWRGNGQVLEVYLKIERPLTLDGYFEATGKDRYTEMNDGRWDPTNFFDNCDVEILEYANKHGYDGIIFKDETGDDGANTLFIVFDDSQIKSATANSGLYLESGSLTDSEKPETVERASAAKAVLATGSKHPKP